MRINITAKPFFSFSLPVKVLEALIKLSEIHYDAYCRSASTKANVYANKGFLIKWHDFSQYINAGNPNEVEVYNASFKEIDTVLKILELVDTPGCKGIFGAEVDTFLRSLPSTLQTALRVANNRVPEWQVTC